MRNGMQIHWTALCWLKQLISPKLNSLLYFACKKKLKKVREVYISPILPASPCAAEFYEIWHTRSTHWHNHVRQMFIRSVQGLRNSDTQKLTFPIHLLRRPYNNVCAAVRHWSKQQKISSNLFSSWWPCHPSLLSPSDLTKFQGESLYGGITGSRKNHRNFRYILETIGLQYSSMVASRKW